MAERPILLLTNDDGIEAEGLLTLERSLESLGDVWVVAPSCERSATSHSLTLRSPIRIRRMGERRAGVDGTPADSVLLAVRCLMPKRPSLVVSGINHGPNLGDDVNYSGTVGAAMEATMLGIPAFAVSLAARGSHNFETAAAFSRALARRILEGGFPGGCMLNVNVPDIAASRIRGAKVARLGRRIYEDMIREHPDGPGEENYRIGDGHPVCERSEDTDCRIIEKGWITVTPLRLDMTDHGSLETFQRWGLELPEFGRAL